MVKIGLKSHFTVVYARSLLEKLGDDVLQVEAVPCGRECAFLCEIDDHAVAALEPSGALCECEDETL